MLVHPCLPLVALVLPDLLLIQVYQLSESSHPQNKRPCFSLQASFRTSSAPKEVKWVGNLEQLLVLTTDCRVELMSSQRCLKIVSRFGNRKALQDSVFACNSGDDIESYVKVGEVSCPDALNMVCVEQKVQIAESRD